MERKLQVSTAARDGADAQLAVPSLQLRKTSARELGAVLCLRIRLGAAAIHHASLTLSEFKGKVAKGLLFLRVF